MTVCYLCLEESGAASKEGSGSINECEEVDLPISTQYIEICSEEGLCLDIAKIINTHFRLQPNYGSICINCWVILSEFHKYYERILTAQEVLKSKCQHLAKIQEDWDPLPSESFPTKLEKTELTAKLESIVSADSNFFDTEVKVEINDLELLPQVEIIEDNLEIYNSKCLKRDTQTKTELKTKKRGRGRPRKNDTLNPPLKKCSSSISDSNIEYNGSVGSSSDNETSESYISQTGMPKRMLMEAKKFSKCLLSSRRFTSDEVEQKKAKQLEYDRVIAKFFDIFACPKCNLLLQDVNELRGHFRLMHQEETGYMVCCNRKFYQRKALAEHIYVHWNPEHFKCNNCGRNFQDARGLEVHEQTHTNNQNGNKEKKIFQCDKCPRNFSLKAAFVHHRFSKHVPRSEFKFSCNECNKKLPTERKLKDHMNYMHNPENAIICDKCGKQMRSQSNLKKHHQIEHSDEPKPAPVPVQCEICGTWLRHIAGLKQHMKTIHEDTGGEHRCHICNKTSTNARALKRHIYHNHECERKFKCTMCEKAFKRPQDLREHTSTHTGEVLYTCPNCPITFFSNANMYKHRQRLHRAEWEEDKKQPRPPNIMQRAVGATAAMKMQQAVGAASAFFARNSETNTQT